MRADRFTAVLDANVIAGGMTRNILLSLAEAGLYRPLRSNDILKEFHRFFQNKLENGPSKVPVNLGAIQLLPLELKDISSSQLSGLALVRT